MDPEGAGDRFRDTLQAHTEGLSSWGIGRLRIFREGESAPPEAQEALEGGGGCLLESLALEVASCTACRLSETRNLTVFGVGDPDADLMLVGEAPGHEEDLRGEPFVGAAGKLLDRILDKQLQQLEENGLDSESFYKDIKKMRDNIAGLVKSEMKDIYQK